MNKLRELENATKDIGWEAKAKWHLEEPDNSTIDLVDEDGAVMASSDAPQVMQYLRALHSCAPDLVAAVATLKRIADSSYDTQAADLIDIARAALRPLLDEAPAPGRSHTPSP